MKTRKVVNLSTLERMEFSPEISPEYAVRYCRANELNIVAWFAFAYSENTTRRELDEKLPLIYGGVTVACGDWCAFKTLNS